MQEERQKKGIKLFAGLQLLTVQVAALFIMFGGALITFILIAKMIFKDNRSAFDVKAFEFLSKYKNNNITYVMEFFSFLGTHTFLIPANIILIIYFLFINKNRWYTISIPSVAITSLSLMFLLKFIFRRNRPLTPLLEQARGYSFPSGHALVSFTFYGLLIYLVWQNLENKWVRWTLVIGLAFLILAIGLSRVYLRVHYASDVIAGYCVGCMWLLLSLWILNEIKKYAGKKVDS